MKTVLKFVLLLGFLFGGLSVTLGQNSDIKPTLIDEFNQVTSGQAKARMDNFWFQLNGEPSATGYIIVYGGESRREFVYPPKQDVQTRCVLPLKNQVQRTISFYQRYLERRELPASRLVIINGGYKEKETTELWMVSPGQESPKPTPTIKEKDIKFRNGKSKKRIVLKDC